MRKRERRRRFETFDPREIPSYRILEAAHYLSIPAATLRSWVRGRHYPTSEGNKFFQPVITLPDENKPLLSFMNLIEAHVLAALRSHHQMSLHRVRSAIEYLSDELGSAHPLADRRLKTDRINLFVEMCGQLVNVSQHGQLAMRQLLKAHLRRVIHDSEGLAKRFYPFVRKDQPDEPKVILIDPLISFGRPVLLGTGIPTEIVAQRYKAGESMKDLARDYGLERPQIEEAIRYELAA